MHQRQVIRTAVVTALAVASTAAGARVEATRMVPWRRQNLPAITVYTLRETVDLVATRQSAPREVERKMPLVIVAAVEMTADPVDQQLDDLAEQIEAVMDADPTLGGEVADACLSETEIDIVEDSAREIGLIRLTYDCLYRTPAPNPNGIPLDAFKRAYIQHDLDSAQDEADRAHDVVTLPGDES